MQGLNIAVAGAGPAGLLTAACLARDGHQVRVFERFVAPRPLGAGLMLQPTGLACLARLGLDRTAISSGAIILRITGRTPRGRCIVDMSYRDLNPAGIGPSKLFGLGIHRGALFKILSDEMQRLHIPITGATEIAASNMGVEGRTLTDQHAQTHGPFDLVIDGTGTNSRLRVGYGNISTNRPYAYGALWGIVQIPSDWPYSATLSQVYDGAHTMAGLLPVGYCPGDGRELAAFFWSMRRQDFDAWRMDGLPAWKARVLALWPEVEPFIAQIQSAEDLTFATYSDMSMRQRYCERLVFIGDASRTTSPQLGQGCNLALIDGTTLALAIREAPTLSEALRTYEARRQAHSAFYSTASRWLTPFFQSDSRTTGALRDIAFPLLGSVPYVKREMVRTMAGMKTGLFSHLDPGHWHPGYGLDVAATMI